MYVAVAGCVHGTLDSLYSTLESARASSSRPIDVLLCCGDFQAMRNLTDLHCMAVPDKYKAMGSFYKYYSGIKTAPVLTVFIGGNHEASNHLQELPFGGWVAPNIYFLGYAASVVVCKRLSGHRTERLRVAGLSGIYKGRDVLRGHFEKPPYDDSALRSVYHVRNVDAFRLTQLSDSPPHVVLSHDWPRGVEWFGDTQQLLRRKPHFKDDVNNGLLGSKPAEDVLRALKPQYWFSAHLHVKFAAVVTHSPDEGGIERRTKFLALDKCLPKRGFLQLLEIEGNIKEESKEEMKVTNSPIPKTEEPSLESEQRLASTSGVWLEHDVAWLSVLQSTDHLFTVNRGSMHMPGPGYEGRWDFKPDSEDIDAISMRLDNDLVIDEAAFHRTVSAFDAEKETESMISVVSRPVYLKRNRQTIELCKRIGISNPCETVGAYDNNDNPEFVTANTSNKTPPKTQSVDESQIPLEEDDDDNVREDGGDKKAFASHSIRPKLSLPAPRVDAETNDLNADFVIDTQPTPLKDQCSSNQADQRRMLKRRNQAIYDQDQDD